LKRGRKAFCPVPDEVFEIVGCDVQFADLAATPKRLGLLVIDLERKAVCITDDEIDRGLRRKTPRHTTFEDFPGINGIPVRRDFDPGGLLRFHFYCERSFVAGGAGSASGVVATEVVSGAVVGGGGSAAG